MDNTQNIISFCTGYAGLELGLRRLSEAFRTICYVEIEAFACANLVAKIEEGKLDAAPIWTDIKTFPASWFSGKVHGITAGYPCQPFSVAGKRKGEDDPRHLWPYIRKHIEAIRPLFVFCENVGGHLQMGFDEVYRSLAGMGYSVEAGLFTAAECGASHRRERLFILGYSQDKRCNWGESRQNKWREPTICPIAGTSIAMANAKGGGLSGAKQERNNKAHNRGRRRNTIEPPQLWPALFRQEQYDWEAPRTVESGMGRTVDGFASRVDELRLLGNGVVPAQAELAFRTLYEELTK